MVTDHSSFKMLINKEQEPVGKQQNFKMESNQNYLKPQVFTARFKKLL